MSNLSLQLNTGQARQELAALDRQLESFRAKLASFSQAKGLENSLARLAAFKGIEASAIQSLDSLARGMQQASSSAGTVANISKALNTLARIRVDSIAGNLERVSRALSGLRIPPSLSRFAGDMQRVAQASGLAANGVMRVSRALGTVRAAPGLSSTARSFERIGTSASGATSGLLTFSRAGSTVSSVMSGFGIALGAVGFANVVKGSYDAVRGMESFKNAVAATQGGMEAANKEWEYVTGVAGRLRISVDGVAESYGSFSAAAHLAGVSTADVHKIFESMSEASRVLNLNSTQVKNAFNALTQMFSKGTVNAEELRQQLGDALPGAMQLMAQAVGVSTSELMKMMQSGEVLASSALPKFADVLHEKFGSAVPQALNSAQAAFDNFGNAMSAASRAFGSGFFDSFKDSLNGLAATMNDPAFIQAAYAWGQALGSAANVALQAIDFVAKNFNALKYAVLGVVGIQLGSVVGGWASTLIGLATSAGTVTRTVAGMTITLGGMGAISGLITMVGTALRGAAVAAVLFVRGLGPIGLAITALTVGVPLAIELYNRWAASADKTAKANSTASDAARGLGSSASSAVPGINSVNQSLGQTTQQANAATEAMERAAWAAAKWGKESRVYNPTLNDMPVTGPSSYNEYGEAVGYAGGGIAGMPTGLTYRLPASAFFNAPSFAGGGISDGGIPAVLHPNEAVVPLTGGGQIPVANVSTGQASLLLLKPLQQMVDYQKQTKTEVSRVWEATTNQTILVKNALDRIEAVLIHIDARLPDILKALVTGFNDVKNSAGSGGSYSSGGSSYSSGSTAHSAGEQLGLELDRQVAQRRAAAASANAWTGVQTDMVMIGGVAVAAGSKRYHELLAEQESANAEMIKARIAAGYYSESQIEQMLKNLRQNEKSPFSAYASGSPNASKDPRGGFMAMLHPNEAVIPLPDGRSVPVDMGSVMDRLTALVSDGDSRVMARAQEYRRTSGRSNSPVINAPITFNIHAKDAASFNQSKDQIMRDFQKALNRATRRIGVSSDIDDPTQRS